jgi:OOP family OmpA-OmpF porin
MSHRFTIRAVGAAGAAALLALPAAAARADGVGVEAGVFAGGNFFDDDIELGNSAYNDQVPGSSALFGLRAAIQFVGGLGLELEGKLVPTSTEAMDDRPSLNSSVLGWRGHLLYQLFSDKPVRPFLLAGIGGETVFMDAPADLYIDSPDTDAAFHWGVGAKFAFAQRFGVRLDLRQGITAGRESDDDLSLIYEGHLGLFFAFGDTSPRAEAKIPIVTPAPPPAPVVADADGDGIPDDVDKCPGEAEIVNQIDDTDGCPEVDSDGDGMLGSADKCPETAEDRDGFEDTDGCADLDNDGDGIADAADKCAAEPETQNGFEDDDGCPDAIPEKVAEFTGVIKGIQFHTGSAKIRKSSKKTLNAAVAILKEYPSIRIEVSGHTDNVGKDEKNLTLSRKRADYVKWYLVDKGIDPLRITTVGYGPERPISDNSTKGGRADNRRIEFRLLTAADKEVLDKDKGPPAPTADPAAPTPGEKGPDD